MEQVWWEVCEVASDSQEHIMFINSTVLEAVPITFARFMVRGVTSHTNHTFVTADVMWASFAPTLEQSFLVALMLIS